MTMSGRANSVDTSEVQDVPPVLQILDRNIQK